MIRQTKKFTPRGAAVFLAGLCSLAYFTSYLSRYTFTVCVSELTSPEVGLITDSDAGLICMMLFIFYGLGQLMSGMLGDRVRAEYLVCIGIAGAEACNLILPFIIGSPAAVAVLWAFHGVIQSMFWPPLVKIVSSYLPRRYFDGSTLSISLAAHVGNIVLYMLSAFFIGNFGSWRAVFNFAAGLCAVSLTLWMFGFLYFREKAPKLENEARVPERSGEKTAPSKEGKLSYAILTSGFLLLVVGTILQGALKEGITAWLPNYVRDVYSLPSSSAILWNMAIPATSIVCLLLINIIYSKFLKNEALGGAVMFGIGTLFAAAIVFFPSLPPVLTVICAAIITASMHGVNLCLIAYLPGRFSRYGKVSTVSGITNACAYIGCSLYMYGITLIESQSLRAFTWFVIPAVGFASCLAALPLWKRFCKKDKQ